MRIHHLAMMAILTAAVGAGCDSAREVRDTGRVDAYGCDSCHGYPPPPSFNPEAHHPVGVGAATCFVCHPSTVVDAGGHTIVAGGTHRNGQVEVVPFQSIACDSCHGTPPNTGKHVFHTTGLGLACAKCHRGFAIGDEATRTTNEAVHMNGEVDVVVDDGTVDGTVIPAARRSDGVWPDSECAACHAAVDAAD